MKTWGGLGNRFSGLPDAKKMDTYLDRTDLLKWKKLKRKQRKNRRKIGKINNRATRREAARW